MAKLAEPKKVGIPLLAPIPNDVTHLVCYYGPEGFTPSYNQNERIMVPIEEVPIEDNHLIFDTRLLPQLEGKFGLSFVLADANDNEEGDFSPLATVPLDLTPPPALGQPVVF